MRLGSDLHAEALQPTRPMTTHSLLAEPETIEVASGKSPDAGLFRIPADRVRIGMFVAELDRPWTDTPFPGHGLLVEADEQLAALRAQCNEVVVDAGFSEPRVQDELRAAAATPVPMPLRCAGATPRCHRPAAPPSRPHAAGDSAPP